MNAPDFLTNNNSVEFFMRDGELYFQCGDKQDTFEDLPVHIADIIRENIDKDATLCNALDQITTDPIEQLKMFCIDRFSAYSPEPDILIKERKLNFETCKNSFGFAILPTMDYGKLTKRELDVLKYLGNGSSMQETAIALKITINTVKMHRDNIYSKTGINNRAKLTLLAYKKGLL